MTGLWRTVPVWPVLLVAVVFSMTIDHPFHFDDEHSITQNPHVQLPVDWDRILTDPAVFSRNPGSGMYRPVVMVSYVANAALGAFDPSGWHVVNLLVHVLCTALVGSLAGRLTGDRLAQYTAALLFGLHPLVAEPVNYISSRSESMALLFCLASMLSYLHARGRVALYALSTTLFTLGLGCKVTAILALPVLILWEASGSRLVTNWRRWAPLGLVAASYVVFVRQLWQEAMLTSPVREPVLHVLTQLKALSYYLKLVLMPVGFTVEHAFVATTYFLDPVVLASAGLMATMLWLTLQAANRRWIYLGLWPVLSLLPTIVVPLNVLVSEHRLYPALAGIALLAGMGVRHLMPSTRRISMLAIVLLAALSIGRNGVWATEQSLWEEAAVRGHSLRAQVRLGVYHRQSGDLDRAEHHLRLALARDADHAPALNNLGNVMRQRGRVDEAEDLYETALNLLPAYPDALINLGSLRAQRGEFDEALDLYERATQIAPDHYQGWNNLGTLFLNQERGVEAETALRQGLRRRPDSARMLYNLSGALELQNRSKEAMQALREAVSHDADYAPAWLNLGNLLHRLGRGSEALTSYERFLETYRGDRVIVEQVRSQMDVLRRAADAQDRPAAG
ncbi:MAG: tetratricopeptide repeat protein [Gemmatimonadetes bacterium]|nr:tetratricopeptide repeat protein [Gemmatimonadota bacterium]MBT7861100.1 tetratricopeptide repeat protein [Gemmatimonadota bacterium]